MKKQTTNLATLMEQYTHMVTSRDEHCAHLRKEQQDVRTTLKDKLKPKLVDEEVDEMATKASVTGGGQIIYEDHVSEVKVLTPLDISRRPRRQSRPSGRFTRRCWSGIPRVIRSRPRG